MPVTGLPVAVEAVLESLMSQYHLVSWQVSGGDRGVVLTLRWSTSEGVLHQSPVRHQSGGGGGGGDGGHPRTHRKRASHHGRSRRTQQWVDNQETETTDSRTLGNPGDFTDNVHRRTAYSIPRHRSIRHNKHHHHHLHHHHHQDIHAVEDHDDPDSDPPPLPPPPPILDNDYQSGTTDLGFESDGSEATTDTVVEAKPKKHQFKQMVQKHKKGILKMGADSKYDHHSATDNTNKDILNRGDEMSNTLYPVSDLDGLDRHENDKTQSLENEDEQSNDQYTEQPKRRYHFRELIRKHSEEIKKIAAERRRKERERQRLRELEKAKAKSRLRASSEDNIVTLSSREDESHSDENLRSQSEANVSSKNVDGARRVRFSEAGAQKDEAKTEAENPKDTDEEKGNQEGDEVEESADPDDEGDSSDAEEIGSHRPRKIGAIFQIGLMVARRSKLK